MPMTTLVNTLNQYNYGKIVPVLAATETLHNAEEAVWLPAGPRRRAYGAHQ